MNCIYGYLALVLCIYALFGKKINKYIMKIKNSKVIKYHYFVGIAALIVATFHFIKSYTGELITTGSISWILLLIVILLGISIIKSKGQKRQIILMIHWGISILMIGIIAFHVISNIIL